MSNPLATLTDAERDQLKAAHRALADAKLDAEIATAVHRAAILSAERSVLVLERSLAQTYGYDPDQPARLSGNQLLAEID